MSGHVAGDGTRSFLGGGHNGAVRVAIDARDGFGSELRGWGRYARCLVDALRAEPPEGFVLEVLETGGAGPEVKRWLLILEGSLPPTLDWVPARPLAD